MIARALLLVAGFAAAASAAQVRAPREEKAPLSGPHQADLKRLDDHLAKDDEAAAASLLRRLQPRLDQQEHRLAAQAYREVVQRAPADTAARLRLGASLPLSGQVRAAEPELARVVAEAKEAPQAHYWMGALLFEQKRYPEAKKHLERALALDPRCVDCMAHLAHAAYLDNDPPLCESFLARAEALDPAHVQSNLVAGILANRNGRHDAASTRRSTTG